MTKKQQIARARNRTIDTTPKQNAPLDIVRAARRVTSLEAKQRRTLRALAAIKGELRIARKQLRALATDTTRDPFNPVPPVKGYDA